MPVSSKILLASQLLQPRQSQKLDFTAPSQPGIYPYVCTYPGHWRRMFGALYVVEDLDDYLADPEGYLARNSLPVEDELCDREMAASLRDAVALLPERHRVVIHGYFFSNILMALS